MKEVVEQRLIIWYRGVRDELNELGMVRFIHNDGVSRFYRWKVLFIFFEEAFHVFFVRLNNFLWIVATVNPTHYNINVLYVPEEYFMFFAAEQIFTIL